MHSNVPFMLRKNDATMLSCTGGIRVYKNTNLLINPFINQFNSL